MEKKQKKPDSIVFDEETEKYDASLKPYATDMGAPVITITDTAAWKNANINKVNNQVKAKFEELKKEYDALMEKYAYNDLIYNAKFNFEPVVGKIYHLYKDKTEQPYLSIIAPEECNFEHLGSFRLNADKMWEKIQKNDN
ncbi:DUF2452 domain-containing protein [Aquimarina hainanensis]|uniref:DUF2452 domain-containing protein n=2 Tax=Aquimarina hainanensis TaxID=1578017 RepID=A0ABW5N969_9FLAO|nr:DUF2452 domain-containing protein [Aquimarina sp. TRL1]QKX07594.1 DUF2452 domain-containing protein [Aquimarina sp. TRL1]